MGQDAAGRAEQQSHCGDGTQAARVRRAPAACLAAVAGPSRERAHFTGTPRPREDSRTPGLRASRSLALVAPLSFGDRSRRPRGSDWPPGVAVTPRWGPKAADGLARVRGCHCPQRRSSRLNVQPFSGLGLPRGGARRVEPGQTRSGRGWVVSKGGAENWGALGHRGLQLGGPQGSGRVSAHSLKHALSACGHIPATRVCTRGPGRVVGRAHAWESPVCVCTGSTVGTRVAQLGSNKRCPGRATATTRAVCPTHTRTDTRTPTAGLADGAPACSAEPRLWTCPAPRWPRPRALSWAAQPRRGLRPVTDRPPTARSAPSAPPRPRCLSPADTVSPQRPVAPRAPPAPGPLWPLSQLLLQHRRHSPHARRLTVCAHHPPRGKALASPRPCHLCLPVPLCPQGWGPAETHHPLVCPHLIICTSLEAHRGVLETPRPWGSHSSPPSRTAGPGRAHSGTPACRPPQLPVGQQPAPLHPAGPASKAPSPPPVISAAAPRLRLPARESPGPGPGRSRPRPAARCDFHILLAACAHLTAAA